MPDKEMLKIVTCPCGEKEYYGEMTWYNGKTYCRECTYDRWEETSSWKRGTNDYVFPLYGDGINYTK